MWGPGRPTALRRILSRVRGDSARLAQSTRIGYLAMAGIMAASFLIALRRMEREVPQEVAQAPDLPAAPEATS